MPKLAAFNTILKKGATPIVQCGDISGPGLSVDMEDVTTHDSAGYWEELVATILRSGSLSFPIVYDPNAATHKNSVGGALYDMISRTANTYTMTFPSTPAVDWTFSAYVTGFEPAAPVGGKLSANVTMKLTGQPTLA
jgi:hypothetical protein